jgi:hypothetical protein
MGLKFTEIGEKDEAILERWMAELREKLVSTQRACSLRPRNLAHAFRSAFLSFCCNLCLFAEASNKSEAQALTPQWFAHSSQKQGDGTKSTRLIFQDC